ncbi:uncharacterized protein LOC110836599 isoform X2 [Zootermopsis nevadensis]|nr:uncharacterized protein LOC110836599 isoform X2 [Zootermopsis nevadensis]
MFCESLQDLISSNRKVHTVSHDAAYYVKLIARNPDEEFDGTYNWYYGGGCLDQLEVDGQVLLLTTKGKKKDQLCVVPLEVKNYWQASLPAASSVQPISGHTIHQLCGLYRQDKGFIGIRLRNVCQLYSLKPSLSLESIHKATSKHPFTGLDMSHHSPGTYCTVTTNRSVQEWDLNAWNCVTSQVTTEKHLADKWCSVSYCTDPHMIRMTDRCCSYFLDKRNIRKSSLLLCPKKVPNILEHCEDISLVFQSCILPHALYVCTSHHVLLYDIRSGSKPLQRWTHLLCSTPLYGCTVAPSSGKELVCIGNQEPGEIVTFLNTWEGKVPYCQVPPFAIPNLHDALYSAHKYGLWLDPFTQQRCKLSLTGLVWLPPQASKLTLLSQTSAGDVFSHILKPREFLGSSEIKEHSRSMGDSTNQNNNLNSGSEIMKDYLKKTEFRCMVNWEQQLLKKKASAILKLTRRKEMEHIYGRLQSCEYKQHHGRKRKIRGGNKWKMSKKVMESCIDVLAPRMLGVWGIEEEPEWYEGQFVFQEHDSPTSHDKVQAWLTSVQNEDQNNVSHNGREQEVRRSKKSQVALNTPQSRKHSQIAIKGLHETLPHGSQNILTHSRKKFATSTPLNSVSRHTEGPTKDILQILDLQVNDTFSQDICVSQNENIQQSRELIQDEECMILSHTTSKMRKKDIKINSTSAGF